MKNYYEVKDNKVLLYVGNKIYEKKYIVLIDLKNFDKIKQAKYWRIIAKPSGKIYIVGRFSPNDKQIYLHKFLINSLDGFCIDHIDGDTFNNLEENLRIVTIAQNNQNRKGAQRNSSTGIRNVYKDKKGKYYIVVTVNKKQYRNGVKYSNVEEADIAARELRKKLMPYNIE
jgi:hypothetical protein